MHTNGIRLTQQRKYYFHINVPMMKPVAALIMPTGTVVTCSTEMEMCLYTLAGGLDVGDMK